MAQTIIPANYRSALGIKDTEKAIRLIKEFFQTNLAFELNLIRTTAPLFVQSGTGINDNLNGTEQPVSFAARGLGGTRVEIVQSLAKWKRIALANYLLAPGEGIYTDMNAIRPDEELDNLHSLYVDQWDWEKVLSPGQRNLETLRSTVESIYDVMRRTEKFVCHHYPQISPILPDRITFLHSEELLERYPKRTPKQRENQAVREFGAVFVIGIGGVLEDGQMHDGRSPDYDDWSTPTGHGRHGLNGDILVHYPVLDGVLELSSMGIRVDAAALSRQLEIRNCTERNELLFHKRLLNGELPESIGGGIGQSRLCMFYLRKAHVGEIQSSVWPEKMVEQCKRGGVVLL